MGAPPRDEARGENVVLVAHPIWKEGTLMSVTHIQDQTMFDLEDRAFLKHAYRQLLGRVPDAQGLRGYLEQLQAGASKQAIYEALASSEEARAHTAKARAPSGSVVHSGRAWAAMRARPSAVGRSQSALAASTRNRDSGTACCT